MDPHDRVDGIHPLGLRHEQAVHAPLGGAYPVALQIAGVGREVFLRPELEGVHEDAQHDAVRPLLGPIQEPEVSLVQEAHGRDAGDAVPTRPLGARPRAHVLRDRELTHGTRRYSAFRTTQSVRYGSLNRATSPTFLPGTGNSRAERGLCNLVERAATSAISAAS